MQKTPNTKKFSKDEAFDNARGIYKAIKLKLQMSTLLDYENK